MKISAGKKILAVILSLSVILSLVYVPFTVKAVDSNTGYWQNERDWANAAVIDFDSVETYAEKKALIPANPDGFYEFTGTFEGTESGNIFMVSDVCYLKLTDCRYVTGGNAFYVKPGGTLYLLLEGDNHVESTSWGPGILIQDGGTVYIDETGDGGTLKALGRGNKEAGIGNGYDNIATGFGDVYMEGGTVAAGGSSVNANGVMGVCVNDLHMYGGTLNAYPNGSSAGNLAGLPGTQAIGIKVNGVFNMFGGEVTANSTNGSAPIDGNISLNTDGTPVKITATKGSGTGSDPVFVDSGGNVLTDPVMVRVSAVEANGNIYMGGLNVTVGSGGPTYTTFYDGCATFMVNGAPDPVSMSFGFSVPRDKWSVLEDTKSVSLTGGETCGDYRLVSVEAVIERPYRIEVVNGTGEGEYSVGEPVTLVADSGPDDDDDDFSGGLNYDYDFRWQIEPEVELTEGTVLTDKMIKFDMPAYDLLAVAIYEEVYRTHVPSATPGYTSTPDPTSAPGQTSAPETAPPPPGTPVPTGKPKETAPPSPTSIGDPCHLYGNVNGDINDIVDGEDLICLKRFILDWDDYLYGAKSGPGNQAFPFDALVKYADVDGDGEEGDGEDLICLKRYILDWDDYLPGADPYKGPGCKDEGFDPVYSGL